MRVLVEWCGCGEECFFRIARIAGPYLLTGWSDRRADPRDEPDGPTGTLAATGVDWALWRLGGRELIKKGAWHRPLFAGLDGRSMAPTMVFLFGH